MRDACEPEKALSAAAGYVMIAAKCFEKWCVRASPQSFDRMTGAPDEP